MYRLQRTLQRPPPPPTNREPLAVSILSPFRPLLLEKKPFHHYRSSSPFLILTLPFHHYRTSPLSLNAHHHLRHRTVLIYKQIWLIWFIHKIIFDLDLVFNICFRLCKLFLFFPPSCSSMEVKWREGEGGLFTIHSQMFVHRSRYVYTHIHG